MLIYFSSFSQFYVSPVNIDIIQIIKILYQTYHIKSTLYMNTLWWNRLLLINIILISSSHFPCSTTIKLFSLCVAWNHKTCAFKNCMASFYMYLCMCLCMFTCVCAKPEEAIGFPPLLLFPVPLREHLSVSLNLLVFGLLTIRKPSCLSTASVRASEVNGGLCLSPWCRATLTSESSLRSSFLWLSIMSQGSPMLYESTRHSLLWLNISCYNSHLNINFTDCLIVGRHICHR